MGVWDSGSFGNDTAMDFVADLQGFGTIHSTLSRFKDCKGAFNADDASIALAACDLLAAALGRPPADLPNVPNFENEDISDDLSKMVKSIIEHVRKNSELAELWAEDDNAEWQLAIDGLIARLTLSTPYKAPNNEKQQKQPDDFLGHCYICNGPVTERDGINFEFTMHGGSTCSLHPHHKCIETSISGPHWQADGSPTEKTKKKLMQDMGFKI